MGIAQFAVTRRVTVAMMATAIVVLGLFALPRLPVDLLPAFQPPVVTVTVLYGNVAPETMETTVTRPIENAVSRVPGIDYLQSDSFQGETVVRAIFKYGTDINVAAVDVQQQVARIRAQLPNDPNLQEPEILKADPNSLPVVRLYVTDSSRTQRDLADLFNTTLSDEFSAVPGVGSVSVAGGQTRAIMVEPNQRLLAGYGLSNATIVQRIASENVDDPAGIIAIGPNEFGIRTSALYRSAPELADTVVAIKNGAPIHLRDVASVRDAIEDQRAFTRLNGVPAVSVVVTAQPDANVVAVADGIRQKITELGQRYPTMTFGVAFEQSGFILEAVHSLEHTALYGALLAVLIILLFLHSLRSTLIVSVSLPIAVLGTLFAAYIFHQTLNTMTLGGLALAVGLIVDDAVVVIENIFRHLAEGERPPDAARNATAQIFAAVMASSVTVITVFVPLLLIPGLQGLIFGPFALTVMTGVAISLFVAVTTVPMLASFALRSGKVTAGSAPGAPSLYRRFSLGFDRLYEGFERRYRRLLAWSLDRPRTVLAVGLLLLATTLFAVRSGIVQTEQFPASDSRFARLDVRTPNGTSLAQTDRVSHLIEAALVKDRRVQEVGVTVGSSFAGVSRPITNQASLSVTLRPDISGLRATRFVEQWQRVLGAAQRTTAPVTISPKLQAIQRDLRATLVGTTVRARTVDILQQIISRGSDNLQIQIYGPDVKRLYALAYGVIPKLAQIPGIVRPDTNITASQPEVDVKIDRRLAAQLGFTTGEVAQDIATATSGTIASYYQINGNQYPIIVENPPAQRRSFASLAELPLVPPAAVGTTGTTSLATVPLGALAAITTGVGPSQISRQDKQRRIDINAPVIGHPLGEALESATKIMNAYPLPSGYRWEYGPAITQNTQTFHALGLVVALAIVLIYMLLAAQFESLIDPLAIMFAVPFAVIGIVGSLVVTHRAFGLTAFIGSLLLVGIAVKNAILVVEFTEQLRHRGLGVREALMQAGARRLRPILMTTLATIGGMTPLALGIEPGSATQAPLGTVVIGGLITSTILSLILVPTLYLVLNGRHARTPRIEPPPSGRAIDRPEPLEPTGVAL